MADYDVSVCNALLIFVDIIDSSVYSSMWGADKFAHRVVSFQDLFCVLGNQYFKDKPSVAEQITAFCQIDARGDEGLVFLIDPEQTGTDLVNKAIRFAFEMKTRMKIMHTKQEDPQPQEVKIAVGIHYGEVAAISRLKMIDGVPRRPIEKIIGYSINYAKRVESSSRVGKFSQVFLSKEAADLIMYEAIALYKHEVSLKGIQSNDEVYEIRSAFLKNVPIETKSGVGDVSDEEVIEYFVDGIAEDDFLRESWLRSFAVSVLDGRKDAIKGTASEIKYLKRIESLAWGRLVEDDPILIFWRAKACENEEKYSRAISYLKEVIGVCPQLVRARTTLIGACYEMIKQEKRVSSDVIFVRDTAEELLERYDWILFEDEKIKLREILNGTKDVSVD